MRKRLRKKLIKQMISGLEDIVIEFPGGAVRVGRSLKKLQLEIALTKRGRSPRNAIRAAREDQRRVTRKLRAIGKQSLWAQLDPSGVSYAVKDEMGQFEVEKEDITPVDLLKSVMEKTPGWNHRKIGEWSSDRYDK
jgi:hypothetical protein